MQILKLIELMSPTTCYAGKVCTFKNLPQIRRRYWFIRPWRYGMFLGSDTRFYDLIHKWKIHTIWIWGIFKIPSPSRKFRQTNSLATNWSEGLVFSIAGLPNCLKVVTHDCTMFQFKNSLYLFMWLSRVWSLSLLPFSFPWICKTCQFVMKPF